MMRIFKSSTMGGARIAVITAFSLAALAFSGCKDDDDPKVYVCGDGVVDEGEACDDGDDNSDTKPNACRTDCTMAGCGDNVVDTGEECDDGPTGSNLCTSECKLIISETCGDGVIDDGEVCDDGENNSDTEPNACRTNCRPASCGDNVIDDGEECDDGAEGSNTCSHTCVALVETDFRWTELTILEPDAHIKSLDSTCENSHLGLLNTVLGGMVGEPADPDADPDYGLSIGQKIPLPIVDGFDVAGVLSVPECFVNESSEKVCDEPAGMVTASWTFMRSTDTGTCFARVPEVANADGWLDNPELTIAPERFPTNASDQCVVGSSEDSFGIQIIIPSLVEIVIELYGMHMAFELDEDTNVMSNGLLAGFLPHAEAQTNEVLEGVFLADIFTSGSEDSCKSDVELDKGPDANGDIVDGWWMYVGFGGDDQVTYID